MTNSTFSAVSVTEKPAFFKKFQIILRKMYFYLCIFISESYWLKRCIFLFFSFLKYQIQFSVLIDWLNDNLIDKMIRIITYMQINLLIDYTIIIRWPPSVCGTLPSRRRALRSLPGVARSGRSERSLCSASMSILEKMISDKRIWWNRRSSQNFKLARATVRFAFLNEFPSTTMNLSVSEMLKVFSCSQYSKRSVLVRN